MRLKKTVKPKIHLYISGGCGNQFFQYAFARMIQETVNGDLEINYNLIRKYKQNRPGNDNLIKCFNVIDYNYKCKTDFGYLVFEFLRFIRGVFRLKDFQKRTYKFYLLVAKLLPFFGVYYFDAAYYPFRVYKRRNIYIRGYFESSKYFKEIDDKIRTEFMPKYPILEQNRKMYERMRSSDSVCITIKRQDIENAKITDIYTYDISYFYHAVDFMKQKLNNPVFFIFSDNIDWCRENFKLDGEVYYEENGNPIWEKIRLMSSCKNFIIHNSTFSWWAQHLSENKDKIVIAPSIWMKRDDQPIDLYEDGWIYINSKGHFVYSHE